MSDTFFKSEVVVEELEDIQSTYTELLKMSSGLKDFTPTERLDHIEKTLELIAKQKVFYARLALASHEVEGEDAAFVKDRIDMMSEEYSGGLNLMSILDQMEEKLQHWRKEIKSRG
jgi:hypothetical protein